MKKIFKSLLVLMFSFLIILPVGCHKNNNDDDPNKISKYGEMETIYYKEILNKTSSKYFVFIMGNTCVACEELESDICSYATLAKKYPTSYFPIYCLNSSDTSNNGDLIAKDGDDSYANFQGTNDYEKIKISTTPGLLVIEKGRVTKFITTKVTNEPKTEIRNYIKGLMD